MHCFMWRSVNEMNTVKLTVEGLVYNTICETRRDPTCLRCAFSYFTHQRTRWLILCARARVYQRRWEMCFLLMNSLRSKSLVAFYEWARSGYYCIRRTNGLSILSHPLYVHLLIITLNYKERHNLCTCFSIMYISEQVYISLMFSRFQYAMLVSRVVARVCVVISPDVGLFFCDVSS